jgi:hypothetical protein
MMSEQKVEYIVVDEKMLGYRRFGSSAVQVLFEPMRGPLNRQAAVQLGVNEVRPATKEDFIQYRVFVGAHEKELSKPLIPVLVHHLKEGVSMSALDPGKVAQALRDRTLEYAWATKKQPEEILRIADEALKTVVTSIVATKSTGATLEQRLLLNLWGRLSPSLQADISEACKDGFDRISPYQGRGDHHFVLRDHEGAFFLGGGVDAPAFDGVLKAGVDAYHSTVDRPDPHENHEHDYIFLPEMLMDAKNAMVRELDAHIVSHICQTSPEVLEDARHTVGDPRSFLDSDALHQAMVSAVVDTRSLYRGAGALVTRLLDAAEACDPDAVARIGSKVRDTALTTEYAFDLAFDCPEGGVLLLRDEKHQLKAALVTFVDEYDSEVVMMDAQGKERLVPFGAQIDIMGVIFPVTIEQQDEIDCAAGIQRNVHVDARKFKGGEVLDVQENESPDVYGVYVTTEACVGDFRNPDMAAHFASRVRGSMEQDGEYALPKLINTDNGDVDTAQVKVFLRSLETHMNSQSHVLDEAAAIMPNQAEQESQPAQESHTQPFLRADD